MPAPSKGYSPPPYDAEDSDIGKMFSKAQKQTNQSSIKEAAVDVGEQLEVLVHRELTTEKLEELIKWSIILGGAFALVGSIFNFLSLSGIKWSIVGLVLIFLTYLIEQKKHEKRYSWYLASGVIFFILGGGIFFVLAGVCNLVTFASLLWQSRQLVLP